MPEPLGSIRLSRSGRSMSKCTRHAVPHGATTPMSFRAASRHTAPSRRARCARASQRYGDPQRLLRLRVRGSNTFMAARMTQNLRQWQSLCITAPRHSERPRRKRLLFSCICLRANGPKQSRDRAGAPAKLTPRSLLRRGMKPSAISLPHQPLRQRIVGSYRWRPRALASLRPLPGRNSYRQRIWAHAHR